MRIPTPILAVSASIVAGACASSRPQFPPQTPPTPITQPDTQVGLPAWRLGLASGTVRYRLTQNTTVYAQGIPDTTRNMITTTAILTVDVMTQEDSAYRITVGVDSVLLTPQGLIATRLPHTLVSLGQVAQASFERDGITVQHQLPDSLCAYAQFLTAVQDILLPQLPANIHAGLSSLRADTLHTTACRAGAKIDMVSTRQLKESTSVQATFELAANTDLRGAGNIGRDFIEISGSIATHGMVSFTEGSRLPSLVETTSDGLITVRLKDSTTVFRQTTSQQIRKQDVMAP